MKTYTLELADIEGTVLTLGKMTRSRVIKFIDGLRADGTHKRIEVTVKTGDGLDAAYKPFGEWILMWLEIPRAPIFNKGDNHAQYI